MRRTHLRGQKNILKRLLIHVGAFNLSLIFRSMPGAGKPRELRNRLVSLFQPVKPRRRSVTPATIQMRVPAGIPIIPVDTRAPFAKPPGQRFQKSVESLWKLRSSDSPLPVGMGVPGLSASTTISLLTVTGSRFVEVLFPRPPSRYLFRHWKI